MKGKHISLSGALLVIVCFFLPWITFSCGSYSVSYTGHDVVTASDSELQQVVQGLADALTGRSLLWVSLAAAILIFVLMLIPRISEANGCILRGIIIAVIAVGVLPIGYLYLALQNFLRAYRRTASWPLAVETQIGFWGTLVGYGLIFIGLIVQGQQNSAEP